MPKVIVTTASSQAQSELLNALEQAPNAYDITTSGNNTVELILTPENVNAQIDLLVQILAANPIYLGAGFIFEQPLAEGIKRSAGLLAGRQSQIDAAIDAQVNGNYTSARNTTLRDPLALDLDNDGLETTGIGSTILFDHDGDGIKSGTGWLKGDDGLLVLDKNANGLIDNGRELFGVDTVKANGQKAVDGFDALRELDSNADAVFNANDAQFANVRVWRDLNQDGVSQSNELSSLASQNITAIGLSPAISTLNLGNGNLQTATADYIRTDGSSGHIANLNFIDNPFYRQFTDSIAVTEAAHALPDLQGAGAVRDLREAASLSTELAASLADYTTQSTRSGQLARLDGLIHGWADSSASVNSVEQAAALGYQLIYLLPGQNPTHYEPYLGYGVAGSTAAGASFDLSVFSAAEQATLAQLKADQAAITRLIGTLESFNGTTFVNLSAGSVSTGAGQTFAVAGSSAGTSSTGAALPGGLQRVYVSLSANQINLLNSSFETLKESVYGGLLTQTRLNVYFDAISLTVDASGVHVNTSGIDALLDSGRQSDAVGALSDLIELNRYRTVPAFMSWAGTVLPICGNGVSLILQ